MCWPPNHLEWVQYKPFLTWAVQGLSPPKSPRDTAAWWRCTYTDVVCVPTPGYQDNSMIPASSHPSDPPSRSGRDSDHLQAPLPPPPHCWSHSIWPGKCTGTVTTQPYVGHSQYIYLGMNTHSRYWKAPTPTHKQSYPNIILLLLVWVFFKVVVLQCLGICMRYQRSKYLCQRGRKIPVSICLQKWDGGTEVSDNLPKRCQHFQLPDRSVCLRERNKKMAQPFGVSLRQNKEQIIHFQIRSPAPVNRCSLVISPVGPSGNNDQCTVWLASLAEALAIWNKKNLL